jgi:acetolactate synthase-1/2/3 large subunit
MITSEALAAGLARHGVKYIFSQCFPMRVQHVAPKYGIRQIGFRTENAGGTMADGYARISHHIGVVGAQGGPAATLLVPPLAEALKASVPILALVEESARIQSDRNAFQELDHFALFTGCSKWTRRIDRASRLDDYLDMAIIQATSGRPGPVVLLLPSDFMGEQAVPSPNRTVKLGHYPLDRVVPPRDRIKEAAAALKSAQAPLIIAGGGVHISDAAAEVAKLSALGSIPVATTNMGKGSINERSPLSLGVFGNCMGRGSRAQHLRTYATAADLVLLVGSRTNANATDAWTLFSPKTRFIHIDVDGFEVGRNFEALRLVGDAKATLAAVLDELTEKDFPNRVANLARIKESTDAALAKSTAILDETGAGRQGAVRPEHLMRTLDAVLRPQDIVCADASFSTNWVSTFLRGKMDGARFLEPRGLAGLGWGLPLAMGAKLARPEANVFAVVGDGGFAHCWSELEAARRADLKVVVIVLNNQILGYQLHGEEALFSNHSDAAVLGPVDHAAIARACDCFGERIASPETFGPALERAIKSDKPAVLDVITDETATPPLGVMAAKAGSVHHQTWGGTKSE